MINYCKTCLNPSTRPNTSFNKEGYCPVCSYERNKIEKNIDWDERKLELNRIKEWGKKNTKSTYDCIVTVSGGKDSMRQAFFIRDELEMNPLLISSIYPPEHLHERGAENLSNLINHGFNCLSLSLDPIIWKKLIRNSFLKFGNYAKSSEMALYAIPIHLAIANKIPLLFYGENPVYTIGESYGGKGGNAISIQEGNTIKGGPKGLKFKSFNKTDYYFYEYPSYNDIKDADLKISYLGYYMQDWYGFKNAEIAIKNGLKIRKEKPEDTGDLWGVSALDEDFTMLNQYFKYLKYGYGRVTDQVCEAIHQGLMTREEALHLVKKYDGKCSKKFIKFFCNYIEISDKTFEKTVDRIVNKKLFKKVNNTWKPIFKVF